MQQPTRRLAVQAEAPQPDIIAAAAAIIRAGGLVAFPTETVYGLGADALNAGAVQGIFAAKGRPVHDPLIVHLASPADLPRVVSAVPPAVEVLTAAYWPGPLTLVLPRGAAVPLAVTAGRATVAVRVPSHPVALALLAAG
ncbi:MAG: Sua5/YciO/YrdC/YwlC family protein, partial [Chloroflexaceae bacterium]|nr:Sua5/YciO/YrdC/YwlC family protein [Chloroflexaceae bacterium]